MHRILALGLCLCATVAVAQPKFKETKWAKKARKSLVTITVRNADGTIAGRQQGFVATEDGRVFTTYDALAKASAAICSVEVQTADGKVYHARRVAAADAMMDFVVLTTDIKKPLPLPSALAKGTNGEEVFVLCAESCVPDTIQKVEMVKQGADTDGQPYYSLNHNGIVQPNPIGAPLLNSEGELLGMVHAADADKAYAVSKTQITAARPNAMAANKSGYNSLPLPALLPDDEDQARTFVFLSNKADSARYVAYADDFIEAFPASTFGYTTKGEYLMAQRDMHGAIETYEKGMQAVQAKDELLHSRANATYRYAISTGDTASTALTSGLPPVQESLRLVSEAISASDQPLYHTLKANILYTLRRYSEAADEFESLGQTNMRSPQNYVYASQSRRMAGDSIGTVLALLDSAVACYPRPLPAEASSAVLLRATTRAEASMWRPAVADYNEYEHLCSGNVNAEFYYQRFIAEANGRMYQQALDDIDRAIIMQPGDAELHAQKALLLYRVGHQDEALPEARKAIELDATWAEELKPVLSQ